MDQTPTVVVKNLTKRYGDTVAVDNVSFSVNPGELLCLLGPSGCGKTTLLRMLAGLIEPTEGEIYLHGQCVFSSERGIFVPPAERGVGLMFQNYALWPHMKVRDNIMYGLKVQKVSKEEAAARVERVAEMLDIKPYLDRYPSELSGGQQQRVSLARMVVVYPKIILMDEPLSNLDAKLRVHTRVELRSLQRELQMTGLYVTHDQEEALALADKIAVMQDGQVLHLGPPVEVYENSKHVFVSDFLGAPPPNLISATVSAQADEATVNIPDFGSLHLNAGIEVTDVTVSIRPEDCTVSRADDERPDDGGTAPADVLRGRFEIVSAQFMGAHYLLIARGQSGQMLHFKHDKHGQQFQTGDHIEATVEAKAVRVYDANTGRLVALGPTVASD